MTDRTVATTTLSVIRMKINLQKENISKVTENELVKIAFYCLQSFFFYKWVGYFLCVNVCQCVVGQRKFAN